MFKNYLLFVSSKANCENYYICTFYKPDMFEDIFNTSGYYEFPSFEVAIFSLLLSFVLSSVIAFTYKLTYKGTVFPNHFFQAMILSSIVTCMIMMAVGNNFAVGFGIIGAVAIIRFRTLISDPRNIIFMFAGISIGIGTGVYGYSIAIAGTVVFCIIAILLSISAYGKFPEAGYVITIEYSDDQAHLDFEELLAPYCKSHYLDSQRNNEQALRRRYNVKLKNGISSEDVFVKLRSTEGIDQVRIDRNEEKTQL